MSVEGFSTCMIEAIDASGGGAGGAETPGLTTNDSMSLMAEIDNAKEKLMASDDEQALTGEFLGRAAGEGTKLTMLRMRTARLLAFASLRLSDAFAAVSPDKKDLAKIHELLAVRTQHEMRLHGVCDVVVKAQIQRM